MMLMVHPKTSQGQLRSWNNTEPHLHFKKYVFTFGHINQWGCQFEILDGLFEPQQQSEQCKTFRYIAVRYIHL